MVNLTFGVDYEYEIKFGEKKTFDLIYDSFLVSFVEKPYYLNFRIYS